MSWARRNEKLNRFIHKNGFDLGKWFHLFGDAWIKNREEISSELEKISEDYLFDIGWNGEQGIEEISRILEEKHITNPTYNSNSERTLIYIKFNLIDNLPDYLKKRYRNQIEQLKKYNKKGQHWQENLPIMEIDLSVRDGVIKDNDVGF